MPYYAARAAMRYAIDADSLLYAPLIPAAISAAAAIRHGLIAARRHAR